MIDVAHTRRLLDPDSYEAEAKAAQIPQWTIHHYTLLCRGCSGPKTVDCAAYDYIALSRPAMGLDPATDGKDTIKCLFRSMVRLFNYDADLERLCSNIVQAAVMEETMQRCRACGPNKLGLAAYRRQVPRVCTLTALAAARGNALHLSISTSVRVVSWRWELHRMRSAARPIDGYTLAHRLSA
jgi:hypothetical protein